MTYSLIYATCEGLSVGSAYEGADYAQVIEWSVVSVPISASSMEEAQEQKRLLAWELGIPEREVRIEKEEDGGRFVDDGEDEVNVWSAW